MFLRARVIDVPNFEQKGQGHRVPNEFLTRRRLINERSLQRRWRQWVLVVWQHVISRTQLRSKTHAWISQSVWSCVVIATLRTWRYNAIYKAHPHGGCISVWLYRRRSFRLLCSSPQTFICVQFPFSLINRRVLKIGITSCTCHGEPLQRAGLSVVLHSNKSGLDEVPCIIGCF